MKEEKKYKRNLHFRVNFSVIKAVSGAELEKKIKGYDFSELWRYAVENEETTLGLDEWVDDLTFLEKKEIIMEEFPGNFHFPIGFGKECASKYYEILGVR